MNEPVDPFDRLAEAPRRVEPRPDFARDLRSQLVAALDLPARLPERSPAVPTLTTSRPIIPYLAVAGGDRALAWYVEALGATLVGDVIHDADGRVGHAELRIGDATVYVADEYPELHLAAPRGTASVSLHLPVDDVDATFARAVAAGANAQRDPADTPYGQRMADLFDPFGHRWRLAQPLAASAPPAPRPAGAIWAALNYADALAGIRFLTDVLGFVPQLVVPDDADPTVIHHSQLAWPEGGVVQAGSANRPGNPYSDRPTGAESLYLVTADPHAVWERCRAAGTEVVQAPMEPDYAPGTMVFSVRDGEGNIFSVGSYAGE